MNTKEESGSEVEDDDDEVFDYYEFVFSMNTQQQVYLNMQNKNTVNDFTQIAKANLILSCEAQQTVPHKSAPLHSGISSILMVN